MSSRSAEPLGCQEPRLLVAPRARWSHAEDAAFLSSSYGLAPDEWQYTVLDAWLAVDRTGRWAAGRCGLAVPRQNGKNAILEMVELYKMVVLGRKILHTAHEIKTARRAFLRLASFFENDRKWPELAALVMEVRRTNGQEAIVLTNGGSCEFVARTRGSGRGYTVDDLVCDEAQELTDEQLEALLPTISAAPSGDPQQFYTGTPPGPSSPGTVFVRMREQIIADQGKRGLRSAWIEWSSEHIVSKWDRAEWAKNNPALGRRLSYSVVEDEAGQMTDEGFARERNGWWAPTAKGSPVISRDDWAEREGPMPAEGRVSFAVKFAVDGSSIVLAAAKRPDEGPVFVEVVERVPASRGTAGLVEWLAERWRRTACIIVDGRAGADAFVLDLKRAGVPERMIVQPTSAVAAAAYAGLVEAVRRKSVVHGGQPGLVESVAASGRRPIGQQGGWGFTPITPDGDETPTEAVALALHAAMTSKRVPGRVQTGMVMT